MSVPVCTVGPRLDLGHGVTAEVRYIDGAPDGVAYWHEPCGEDYVPVQPAWPGEWKVESIEPLTLAPSLLCRRCQHHGFIRDGRWVPA